MAVTAIFGSTFTRSANFCIKTTSTNNMTHVASHSFYFIVFFFGGGKGIFWRDEDTNPGCCLRYYMHIAK